MTIPVTCPSCDKVLKVKDELAGRKVKCPACGETLVVPAAADESFSSRAPANDQGPDEGRREEGRRRKKKKKSNTALLIALAGGAVFLLLAAVAGVLVVVFVLPGKDKTESQAKTADTPKGPPKGKGPPQQEEGPPPKGPAGGIRRAPERAEIMNALKQLGLAYHQAELTNNKAPSKREDLAPFYEKSRQIDDLLTSNYITFIYGVRSQQMTYGSSNTILAYETLADNAGERCVLMGDGSAQTMRSDEFNKAPKAGQK